MTTRSISMPYIFSIVLILCSGCLPQVEDNLKEALRLYRENELDKALTYFEREIEKNQNNADAFAWLAETYRRLHQPQKADEAARKALELDSRHSIAHAVLADTYNPQYGEWEQADYDTTWHHLLLAVESDSNDGNAWLSVWIEAMRRGEDALWEKALRSMVRTNFITSSLIAYNRWVLNHLPENALLFTNGDMDTYPAVALQLMEGYRTDVAIVNISLLNLPWYARFISRHYNVQLPFQDSELDSLRYLQGPGETIITISNQIVEGWFKQKGDNRLSMPIAIASTVYQESLPNVEDHIKTIGPYSLWFPQKVDNPFDTVLMRQSVASVNPGDFKGPFVSPQDRSPIRMTSSNGVSGNVIRIVMYYTGILIEAKRFQEASRTLDVAEEIDKSIDTGQLFADEIAELRKASSR